MMTSTDDYSVKLFVRMEPETGLESRKEAAVQRLADLADTGAIADYEILVWGRKLRPDGPLKDVPYCERLVEHVSTIQQWLEDHGASCRAFDRHDVECSITNERYDAIALPALCLAVYAGERLVDVYPRRDTERSESIVDGLESLQRQRVKVDE